MVKSVKLIVALRILVATYFTMWFLSFGVVYSFYTDNAYEQVEEARVHGVNVHVWVNPVSNTLTRNWLLLF